MTKKLRQTDKKNKPPELEEYRTKKLQSRRISALYDVFNPAKSARMSRCNDILQFEERRKGQKTVSRRLAGAMHCYIRLCPICAWRKAKMVFSEVMQVIKQPEFAEMRFIFLTLTVKNCKAEALRDEIDRIIKAYRELTVNDTCFFSTYFTGTFRAVEVTYNAKTDTYHPHMHVLAAVKPDYFKKSNAKYMSHEKLVKIWRDKCKIDYDPAVRIQPVKGAKHKSVAEIAKYTVKPSDIPDEDVLEILDEALRRKRLTAFTGLFRRVKARIKAEPALPEFAELLESKTPETAEALEIWRTIYKWNIGARAYELADEERID
jgi:plasmid rolling circle replication initiator protein Rep